MTTRSTGSREKEVVCEFSQLLKSLQSCQIREWACSVASPRPALGKKEEEDK